MASKNKSKRDSQSQANDPVVHKAAPGHEDDLIIVPKERSKFYYLLMLGLMMFTLLIFTVGGLFETVVGGGGGAVDDVVLRWQEPDGPQHELKASEFQRAKQSVDLLANMGFYIPIEGRENGIEDEDAVLTIVLDRMAQKSGIEVSPREFTKRLKSAGWNADVIAQYANMYRRPRAQIEQEILRGLRISKFASRVLQMASSAPDPQKVVERWQENNPEYQFQVIELTGEAFVEQAKTEVPADPELTEWFHARPAFEQRQFFTEEKLLPLVAYVKLDGDYDLTNLLDLYPAPEEWDEALQSETYYNRYTTTRFKRPEPSEEESNSGEEGEGEESAAEQDQPLYYTLEEVQEQVTREANISRALGQFVADFQQRVAKAKENPDLTAPNFKEEVISLGLEFYAPTELITRTETLENQDWGGAQTANQLGFLSAGGITRQAVVNETSMMIAQIEQKVRPQEPPFEEIRDEVADKWAEVRAQEIAQETLRGIYDSFQTETTTPEDGSEAEAIDEPVVVEAEAFAKAVNEAGLTIIERPYLGRGESPADKLEDETDLDRFLRSQGVLYTMDEKALAPPSQSFDRKTTYLVRLADQRDPDPSGMKARDLLTLRESLRIEQFTDFRTTALDPKSEAFQSKFDVWLKYWEEDEQASSEGDDEPGT